MTCRRIESIDLEALWVEREGPEWTSFRDHYPTCAACSEAVARLTAIPAALEEHGASSAHPTSEQLLDFKVARGSLPPDDVRRVELHLQDCPTCRDAMGVLRSFDWAAVQTDTRPGAADRTAPALPSRPWWERILAASGAPGRVGAFAAAAVVLVALASLRLLVDAPRPDVEDASPPVTLAERVGEAAPSPPQATPSLAPEASSLALAEPAAAPPRSEAGALETDAPMTTAVAPPTGVASTEPAEATGEETDTGAPAPSDSLVAGEVTLLAAHWPDRMPGYAVDAGLVDPTRVVRFAPGEARGPAGPMPRLRLVVPEHEGVSSSATPTLYWHLDEPSPYVAEIALSDDAAIDPLIEVRVEAPIEAGLHAFDLAQAGVRLEPRVSYRWTVELVPDPEERRYDGVASSRVRFEPPDDTTRAALDAGPAAERAHRAASRGYWLDAFALVQAWRLEQPDEATLRRYAAALLEQVGLGQVAEERR